MKRQIKIWGSRSFVLVMVVLAVQQWGMPTYKRHFVKKQAEVYVPTAKVQEGKFIVSFHEIGALQAENSVPITSPQNGGKILSIIPEGTRVQAGDLVVEMDTNDLQREIRDKQLAYKNALAEVDRAISEKELLVQSNATELAKQEKQYKFNEAELERAEEDLKKQQRLADEQLVPGSKVEAAQLTVRTKKLEVEKGEMDLVLKKKEIESKEKQKDADVDKVRFASQIAKSNLEEVEGRVKQAKICAPAAGMVVIGKTWDGQRERNWQAGDTVWPRHMICTLPDLSSMLVNVDVGEADAPKISIGLPVLIRLDAVPNKLFHGKIKDISKLATEDNWRSATPGKKSFQVTVAVTEVDPETLKPGMTADLEFIQKEVAKAIYVPIEAVTEIKGKTYAYVKQDKKWKRVQVKVGQRNDNFVIIEKGVKKGDVVALRDPTRSLDDQEAGAQSPDSEEKKEKQEKKAAPIPGADKK